MKRHLSVLMVSARATLRWVLLLLGVMAAAEIALFCITRESWRSSGSFEYAVSCSGTPIVCGVCFLLLCALLLLTNALGSKTLYTTARLRVSKEQFLLWQGVYNAGCMLAFWAVQALTVVGLAALYARLFSVPDPTAIGPQALLLAVYNNRFLHAVVPLADALCTLRNVVLVPMLGFALAGGTHELRRGGVPAFAAITVILAAVFFRVDLGSGSANVLLAVGMTVIAGLAVGDALSEELPDE